jgi:ATP-binding protein involved in chromosome partitioning
LQIIAIMSGKGGVGKSTVSLHLARALVARGAAVGLLDADFYGPNIPIMLGLRQTRALRRWLLGRSAQFGPVELEPIEHDGLKLMSVGLLIAETQAMLMPATLSEFVADQLINDVAWGELDYMIVDFPPGTADVQNQLLRMADFSGAIVVLGPQDAAHLDGGRVLTMLRSLGIRVIGIIENMTEMVCPHCAQAIEVFPSVAEHRSILGQAELLGSVPIDNLYTRVEGVDQRFTDIASRVIERLSSTDC